MNLLREGKRAMINWDELEAADEDVKSSVEASLKSSGAPIVTESDYVAAADRVTKNLGDFFIAEERYKMWRMAEAEMTDAEFAKFAESVLGPRYEHILRKKIASDITTAKKEIVQHAAHAKPNTLTRVANAEHAAALAVASKIVLGEIKVASKVTPSKTEENGN